MEAALTCSVGDCEASVLARGLCSKHYQRWRATGDPTTPRWHSQATTCKICGAAPTLAHSLCSKHYSRLARRGDVEAVAERSRNRGTGRCWLGHELVHLGGRSVCRTCRNAWSQARRESDADYYEANRERERDRDREVRAKAKAFDALMKRLENA